MHATKQATVSFPTRKIPDTPASTDAPTLEDLKPSPGGLGRRALQTESLEALLEDYRKFENPMAAFQLSEKLFPTIARMARRLGLKPDRAEDAAQETLIKVFAKVDSFTPGKPVLPWVIAIARNTIYDHGRRVSTVAKYERPASTFPAKSNQGNGPLGMLDISNESSDLPADEIAIREEERAALKDGMQDLKGMHRHDGLNRDLLIDSLVDPLPYKDIAEQLHIPLGTVKSRLNQLRKELIKIVKTRIQESHNPIG